MITRIPVLLLRDIVMFPNIIAPLIVGRKKSINALRKTFDEDKKILVLAQKNPNDDNPTTHEIYHTGVLCKILQLLTLPDGTIKVLVEGLEKADVKLFNDSKDYLSAFCNEVKTKDKEDDNTKAFVRALNKNFRRFATIDKKISAEVVSHIKQLTSPDAIGYSIANAMPVKIFKKQEILETKKLNDRLEKILSLIEGEIALNNTEKKIRSRVRQQMEKSQKDYYLNEQMKAIQKELGDEHDANAEINELEEKIKTTKLSAEAKEKADSELKRLKSMSPISAEAAVCRNYLELLLDLPWEKFNKVKTDIAKSKKILDRDHYGLEKVKERILEYLAVQKRTKEIKGPILCLVGPPGVGKTSLGKSVAEATGRRFSRIALGGVRDESEIRGHRRTYIGSMPGRIIQSLKKVDSSNPLMILDEIDKMGADFRGDPASAMLEVLDPEQNKAFSDHYLEVDYDLSKVMFIATANSLDLPRPLLDRMEIIHISGYTENEKLEIAKRHLIPKQLKSHHVKTTEWAVNKSAMLDIVRYYTREAGVRQLEREFAKLIRKAVLEIETIKSAKGKTAKISVNSKNLKDYLGVRKYSYGQTEKTNLVGITTGLAYTQAGGDILQIEAVAMPGKGKISVTGKLGDVMKESVQAASNYVRSKCLEYGVTPPEYWKRDIHIHVPEGATPKDGPSAGVAMCTSIVSVLTNIPVRKDVAMTGEITLRGRVLPIGGLKEKLLAASRAGVKIVLIPKDNVKDLEEIPDLIKEGLEIIPVEKAKEALNIALEKQPQAVKWDETADFLTKSTENSDKAQITH